MGKMGVRYQLLSSLVCVTLALLVWPDARALAQGQIDVSENQVILNFPDTVTFTIEASAPAEITDITLTYGTNARSCQEGGARQNVDFEPGSAVQAEWEWEMKRSGSVPPGAMIWWSWTVEDEDGNTFTTERQEMTVTDGRHEWNNIERDGISINWFSGDSEFAEDVLTTAQSELARLSSEIGVDAPSEVQFWLYPTAKEVRDALVISADWTGAVAFPDYQIMILSLAPGQDQWAADVIPHELTHLVVGVAIDNCRGGYIPTWVSEGLAVYGESAVNADDIEAMEKALQEERLLSLRSLADGFSAYGGGARLAYTQSGEVVRYMLEQYGPEQMDAFLVAIRDGLSPDQALEQAYGFDTGELDARWRLALGYQATPTSAAAQALEDATPTLVPTIPMVGQVVASTATATPEPATATARPSPTPTEITVEPSPVLSATSSPADEVADALNTPENTPSPVPSAAGDVDDGRSSPLPWIAGIGLGLVALLVGGYFVLRKGG